MARVIAESILMYKIEKLSTKCKKALANGDVDRVWKLNMKIDQCKNRMISWSYAFL